MFMKKTILVAALATGLALPTPSSAFVAKKDDSGAVVLLLIMGIGAALLLTGGLAGDGSTLSTKNGKVDPYTGRTSGKVIADF